MMISNTNTGNNLNNWNINKKGIGSKILDFWANLFSAEKNEKISRLIANNIFWWELDISWEFGMKWKDLAYIVDHSSGINKLILWNIKIDKKNAETLLKLAEKWITIKTSDNTVVNDDAIKYIRRTEFFDKFENSAINPQTVEKKKNTLDIKKLISNVLEIWIISKDDFFLAKLADNNEINKNIYKLLNNKTEDSVSKYNTELRRSINELENEELAQIRELFSEVFTIISDNSDKIWDIKNIRLSAEEADEIRSMESNRKAFEISKKNKETYTEEENKKEEELSEKVKERKSITDNSFARNFSNKLSDKLLEIQELIITIEKKIEEKEEEKETLEDEIEANKNLINKNNKKDIQWEIDKIIEDKIDEQKDIKEEKEELVKENKDKIVELEKNIKNDSLKWQLPEERIEAKRKLRSIKSEIELLEWKNKILEDEIKLAKEKIEKIKNNKNEILQETKDKLEEENRWIESKNEDLNKKLNEVVKNIEELEKETEKQEKFTDFIDWELLDAIYDAEAWDEDGEKTKENIDIIWKEIRSKTKILNNENKRELWPILVELANNTQKTMDELLCQEEDENGNRTEEEKDLFEAKESARINKEKEDRNMWDLNWVYNQRKHEELKIKLEDDANDASNKVKLISKILAKEAAKEWWTLKGKFDNFTEIVKKLWLDVTSKVSHKQNVNTPNFGNMVADIEDHDIWEQKTWLYAANIIAKINGLLVWLSSWVWLSQLAIKFRPREVTDQNSLITMTLWLIAWWTAYEYNDKKFKNRVSEVTKENLFKKKNRTILEWIHSKKVIKPLIFASILSIADASSVWTLMFGKHKKDVKIAEISTKQKIYDWATAKFNKFLETAKDKSVADINDILAKENAWLLWTGKWKWPHRVAEYAILYGEDAIRNLASQDSNIKWIEEWITLAKSASPEWLWLFAPVLEHVEEAIKSWHKDMKFDWSTVKRNDVWYYWSEIWNIKRIPKFGEEVWAALPSTAVKIGNFAKTVWKEMDNEWKSAQIITKEYNKAWSKIKKALSNIWSQIQLTLVDEANANKELAERIKKWDEIVKELASIDAYTDIFSMRNFVKNSQWTKIAMLMLLAIWAVLAHLHWAKTWIYAFATRNKKKEYEKQIMALWWPEWVKRVEELNIALMPALLITPVWRASLSEYSDEQISQFVYGSIEKWSITTPINTTENTKISDKQITNVKNAIINRWGEFLEQITPEEWKEINKEIWSAKVCQWLPSEFYNNYIYDQNVANQVTTIFIGKLMQKSLIFRKTFRSSDLLGK